MADTPASNPSPAPVTAVKKDDEKVIVTGTPLVPRHEHHKSNDGPKGGRYIKDGVAVDAFGNPHKDKATPEELKPNPPVPDTGPTAVPVTGIATK